MSVRDIKDENKNLEGDPTFKQERRQLAQEWSQQGADSAAQTASVLVVNPTHVAIAIRYDKEDSPVPIVTGRGEDHIARGMRDVAEEAGVPILRNEMLARKLLSDTEDGEPVPRDLFDIVAEIILWARGVSERLEQERSIAGADYQSDTSRPVPGEDLTRYAGQDTPA